MAAPINISALTAIDLGTLPASISQNVHDAGTTYTVWYKYTALTTELVLGIFGFGDLVTYKPTINIYIGPAAAPVFTDIFGAQNLPVQLAMVAGTTYYFEFQTNAGNPNPAVLLIEAETAPIKVIPAGSIFVNDDSGSVYLPAALLSGVDGDDFNVLNFVSPFPSGEAGDVLAVGGQILVSDEFVDNNLKLYDKKFDLITAIAFSWTGSPRIRANQTANKFWVGSTGSGMTNATVRTVSSTGVLGGTTYDLGGAGLTALAANNNDTILYFSGLGGSTNSQISRWDLVTDAALSDLVADIGGTYKVVDILYLSDNTLIVLYFQASDQDTIVKQYNALTGATLNTYSLGGSFSSTTPRLAYAINSPNSFVIGTHPSGSGTWVFREIKISDGSDIINVTHAEYESGVNQESATATPNSRFGASFSCPILITRFGISVTNNDESLLVEGTAINNRSGIYKIIPRSEKSNDTLWDQDLVGTTDVKIP